MKIRDHIQTEVFAARAAKHGALVIYDSDRPRTVRKFTAGIRSRGGECRQPSLE